MKDRTLQRKKRKVPRRPAPAGDHRLIDKVFAHVQRHIGRIDRVFHGAQSEPVHVDLLCVGAGAGGGFHTVITCGMSERRMGDLDCDCGHAELLLRLPPGWPLDEGAFQDPRHAWPLQELGNLARFPHVLDTMLWGGHTVANGAGLPGGPEPIGAGTEFRGWVLDDPLWAPRAFRWLPVEPGRKVRFFSIIPVYAEELELAYGRGTETLLRHLELAGVSDLVDVARPNLLACLH